MLFSTYPFLEVASNHKTRPMILHRSFISDMHMIYQIWSSMLLFWPAAFFFWCISFLPIAFVLATFSCALSTDRCRAIGAEDFILKPLQTKDVQKLRSYARPMAPAPKAGTKRKMPLDLMGENGGSERRPRLAGVAVA